MRIIAVVVVAVLVLPHALAQDPSQVVFVPAERVHSDLRKAPARLPGLFYVELFQTSEYSAVVVRRTAPAQAEVHKRMTDIWYVMEGEGTLVTGGALAGVTEPAPGELRGHSVTGGKEQRVARGDILRIPAGVPHWVRSIKGKEIVYLVVKAASPK